MLGDFGEAVEDEIMNEEIVQLVKLSVVVQSDEFRECS